MKRTNTLWAVADKFVPWLVILAVGFFFRIWQLPEQLLADDEWHAVHMLMQSDFTGIFISFGLADHSIPLTLYYKVLTLTTGLSEWAMRLPLLLAGLLLIVVFPWLLREKIRLSEQLMLACLIALSPILIYFSRTARPYAISTLFAFTALIAFYHWWTKRSFKWGVIYIGATALAAWFHLLTLAITLAPFVYFGAIALWSDICKHEFQGILRLGMIGLPTLIVLLLLLGVPIYNDFTSLSSKGGVDTINLSSLWATLSLFIGSANLFVILCWSILASIGARVLASRHPLLAGYFMSTAVIACTLIISTSAAWIHHPLVLARYLLPILPILLLLVALGVVYLVRAYSKIIQLSLVLGLLLLFYLTGPLPAQYHQPLNQFTGHMSYQFDYDKERNIYNKQLKLSEEDVPDFYQQLAKLPADSVTLVVAPWYMEWHWNSWHLYQQIHRQRIVAGFITGLCTDSTFGEYSPDQVGINFTNIVHLTELAKKNKIGADYLIYHRKLARQPPSDIRPNINFKQCEQRINTLFGPPVINDSDMLVYRLH